MQGRSVRYVAVALAVVAGAIAAAVTTGGGGDSGPNLIAHSAELADDAGSARLIFTGSINVPEAAGSVTFGGEGEMAGDRSRMTMSFSAGPAGAEAAAEQFEIDMVTVGPVVYMRMPGLQEGLGVPTPWLSIDIGKADADLAELFQAQGAGGNDPQATLDFLRGAADDFEEVGAEPVRGTDTTHYRGTVDLSKAADELPADQRDAFRRVMEQFETQVGSLRLPIDVWIDGDGLPRRLRYELDLSSDPQVPPGTTMEFTMEMHDYGVAVTIEPPPGDQVTDVTETVSQLGGLGGQAG